MFNAGVRLPESVVGQEWFREELRGRGYVQGQKVVYEDAGLRDMPNAYRISPPTWYA